MIDINQMVTRFLSWKLPKDFHPDGGISFKPTKPYEGDEYGNSWWPIGTNLLTAAQARQMFEHVMDGQADEIERLTSQVAVLEATVMAANAMLSGAPAWHQNHREAQILLKDYLNDERPTPLKGQS